jgi:hypothetical protein
MATQVTLNSGSVDSAGSLALKTNGTTTAVTVGTDQSFNFSATGQRITGDFSNATVANRPLFQSSTTNGQTALGLLPNGTSTQTQYIAFNSTDPANGSYIQTLISATEGRINSGQLGTGTNLPMTFYTGGSERIRVDTSGNVGIGTSSPSVKLDIVGANNGSQIQFGNGRLYTFKTSASSGFDNSLLTLDSNSSVSNYAWAIGGAEKVRIDSSGNLLVGVTSAVASERFNVTGSVSGFVSRISNASASPQGTTIFYSGATPNNSTAQFIYCYDASALRMEVRSNGGIANFSGNNVNLSDRREKTNFAPAGDYLAKICAIPVQTFNYIDQNMEEDDGLTLGVVAQDVQAVAPEMVMESNWAGKDEEPKMRLSIYQTDLQYALMKSIQELKAIVDAQAVEIAALKGTA